MRFIPPEPEEDEKVVEEPPKQEELENKVTATKTEQGDPNANADQVIEVKEEPRAETKVVAIPEKPKEEEVFDVVEQMPQFPGGDAELLKYLRGNIKYPRMASENNIEGKVFVSFVVKSDGSITNVKVLRGIGGGCDEEAVRVVKSMPSWLPGKQGGRPVPVSFKLPVVFKLE